jgi:hypothetical protein
VPTNLAIFLVFVGGFCFLRLFNLTRYASQTWEGPRLIFWTGTASAGLLLLSRKTTLFLMPTQAGLSLRNAVKEVAPWDFSGTIGGSIVLGIGAPLVLNLVFSGKTAGWLASRSMGSRLHHLLYDLVGSGKAICVTLSDRKVYLGLVIKAPRLHPDEEYFELLPLRSGCRDKDTGEMRFLLDYSPLLRALRDGDPRLRRHQQDDFLILLPFKEVVSARPFDPDIYTGTFFQPTASEASGVGPQTVEAFAGRP